MKTLRGKVILVTGAGGAIAGAVESAFRREGAQLVLADREGVRIAGRAAPYGLAPLEADFSTWAGAQAVVSQIEAELGRLDGLVHLVGEVVSGDLKDTDEDAFNRVFSSNVRTLFYATKAALPLLRSADEAFVAGIASEGAWRGALAGAGVFSAAKSAVATYLRTLSLELSSTAIDVAVVFPLGFVDIPTNRARFPSSAAHPMIQPYAVAQAFVAAATALGGRFVELPVYPPRVPAVGV